MTEEGEAMVNTIMVVELYSCCDETAFEGQLGVERVGRKVPDVRMYSQLGPEMEIITMLLKLAECLFFFLYTNIFSIAKIY